MPDATDEEGRSHRPRAVRRVVWAVELVELTLGVVLVIAMTVLVMMQVLARVTPLPGEVWTGELAKFCLIWLAFGLSGYLIGRDEHITIDAVDHWLPPLGQRLVKVFALLVTAVTCAAFAYEGYDLWSSGSPISSPAAGIPLGWIYFIPMLGMAMTAFRAVLELILPVDHGRVLRVAGEVVADSSTPVDSVERAR